MLAVKSALKSVPLTRSTTIPDLDRRFIFILLSSLSLLVLFSLSSSSSVALSLGQISHSADSLKSFFSPPSRSSSSSSSAAAKPAPHGQRTKTSGSGSGVGGSRKEWKKKALRQSRMAVCLVGGARRFELTGPSIIERILREFPNSDLFLNSPLDGNSYKLSLLKDAPRIASVRIFKPQPIVEEEDQARVLTASNSPNGIQGLLQYFNLVEGCLNLIEDYETQNKFTYDWIVRTRVDGHWSGPLEPSSFVPGKYVVPPGSSYGGLNDRFGVGDKNTSIIALSRLSLIPTLDTKGFRQLNSETSFKAQLTTHGVPFLTKDQPFCIVSDRKYNFPPARFGVPVAAISSPGPLNGAKCRPCKPVCVGACVGEAMIPLEKWWSWIEWKGGRVQLCDASGEWESGWEGIFDQFTGKKMADARRRVEVMKAGECLKDFEEMRKKVGGQWETPPVDAICRFGLGLKGAGSR